MVSQAAGARAMAGRGEVALARGRGRDALDLYRRARDLDPSDGGIARRLEELQARSLGRP